MYIYIYTYWIIRIPANDTLVRPLSGRQLGQAKSRPPMVLLEEIDGAGGYGG